MDGHLSSHSMGCGQNPGYRWSSIIILTLGMGETAKAAVLSCKQDVAGSIPASSTGHGHIKPLIK